MHPTPRFLSRCLWFLARILGLVLWASSARAFYPSSELGANFAPEVDFLGSGNDGGSVCDPYINPDASSRALAGCPTQGTGWKSVFDSAAGILEGMRHVVHLPCLEHSKEHDRLLAALSEYC